MAGPTQYSDFTSPTSPFPDPGVQPTPTPTPDGAFSGQKIKVQGGAIKYKTADPAGSLDFTIGGELTIRDETGINTVGNIYSAGDLNIDAEGDILINGVLWPPSGSGTVTSVDASGGTTGLTFTGGPVTGTGTLTLGGTLSIANGGTGATNPAAALTNILPTQTGNSGKVLTTDGASVSWATASGSGGLGVDQTWQSVSRSSGVTYYNTTGKPISIAIGNNGGSSFNSVMYISIDGGSYFPFGGGVQGNGGAYVWGGTVIVPAGSSYAVSASSITSWYELR